MSTGLFELSPTWCNNKIITYDFCLVPYDCLSGTTSPMPTLYNSKVYYTIPTAPTTYLWWSSNLNKWMFSETLGTPSTITLDYTGDYPYTSTVKWDGNFVGSQYFKTCDCTCFTKPNYSDNNFLPINECGVITIHPMNINCIPIPPSKPDGSGSLSLQIVGGTPPYSIRLLNSTGNSTYGVISSSNVFNIPNLLPGTYFVEVTDNFGDFQQVINCTIPIPTTTTTTTINLPTPSYEEYSMCMTVRISSIEGRVPQVTTFYLSYTLYSFTNDNGVVSPIFISNTGNELIIWDYNINRWSLSASTFSQINSNWTIVNTTQINSIPLGPWFLVTPVQGINVTITTIPLTTGSPICKNKTLFFFINEGWWRYYGANIPSQYRGIACGGDNKTPWFRWSTLNLGTTMVTSYEILCTNSSNGDVYFNVTNIDPTQTEVSDIIPWIGTPTTGNTLNNLLRNNRGWQGPCIGTSNPINFDVTLTANLSIGPPLTASINFIYCQNTLNGVCQL